MSTIFKEFKHSKITIKEKFLLLFKRSILITEGNRWCKYKVLNGVTYVLEEGIND